MQSLRQLGVGIIIAIVSVILVMGGVLLALAETFPALSTPTQIPPTLPFEFPTPTATGSPTPGLETPTTTATPTDTQTASPAPTNMLAAPTVCTPPAGWIRVFSGAGDTIYSLAQRYKTSAESLSAANCLLSAELPGGTALYVPPVPTVTVIPCGPPPGWVRAHVVQRGDTLFRIALSYGITYPQLQRANCMGSSTIIYAGQRLWVPNVPTRTPVPGITIIPDFPTSTNTLAPVETTPPPTATATEPAPPTWTTAPTTADEPIATSTPLTPNQSSP